MHISYFRVIITEMHTSDIFLADTYEKRKNERVDIMVVYYAMLIVFLVLGWVFCVKWKSQKNIILYLGICGVILVFVATFRYSIGYDYFNYQRIFEEISTLSLNEIFSSYVYKKFLGYALLNKLIAIIGGDYIILLLVINLALTAMVLRHIYKYSKMPWLSLFLYVTLQFFAHSMNLIRQSIAATICLVSYYFIREKKLIPFLVLVGIACTFHLSAVFMVGFYIVAHWKSDWKVYLILGTISVIVYIYSTPITEFITTYIFKSYSGYVTTRYWQPLKWTYAVFPAIYFFLTLMQSKKLLKEDSKNCVIINSSFYTLLFYFFCTRHMILERFSIYVFLFSMILIPELVDSFKVQTMPPDDNPQPGQYLEWFRKNQDIALQRGSRLVAGLAAVIICMCYLLFASAQGSNGYHKVYPYISVWQKEE